MKGGTMSIMKALNKRYPDQYHDATTIKLIMMIPLLETMDSTQLALCPKVEQLSLSTNCIDKMKALPNLRYLRILSLSRNNIKKISGLEEVGDTLE